MSVTRIAGIVLWLAAALVVPPVAAQVTQNRAAALAQDAAEYARIYTVSQDEAVRRLTAQHDSVAVTDAIAAHETRLATSRPWI